MLIPFLDREFEIEGKPVDVGVPYKEERYQYRILTINEKREGYAVEDFDPALRDRAVFQIPVDVFPQSERDVQAMLDSLASTSPQAAIQQSPPKARVCPQCHKGPGKRKGYEAGEWQFICTDDSHHQWTEKDDSLFPVVLNLYEYLRCIPVEKTAVRFLVYLSGLSNCVRSLTGYKEGILLSPATHCNECHHSKHLYNANLCGNIRAPSARALVNLQRVAQGFALLRVWKAEKEAVSVTLEDIVTAGPFVLRGKLALTSEWLQTSGPPAREFKGCEWEAIREILRYLEGPFRKFLSQPTYVLLEKHLEGQSLRLEEVERLISHADNRKEADNWAVNKVRMERLRDRLQKEARRP